MLTVALTSLRFHSFHGMYPEEQVTGNEFEVDISVDLDEPSEAGDIGSSVDYELVHAIVKREMMIPRKLLEEVVAAMASAVSARFPFIRRLSVTVKKLHPPVPGEAANSSVTLYKEFRS